MFDKFDNSCRIFRIIEKRGKKNEQPVKVPVGKTGKLRRQTFPNKTLCKMATSTGGKPVQPMKLFSEWDVENTAPNCIPRYYILMLLNRLKQTK